MIKEEHKQILASLSSLLENEHDMIANMANTSAVLYEFLPDINWAGFYLYKNNELILGPFQGKPACMHIPMGKGVCGVCAKTLLTQRIDNVHEFPGHIACDCASNSEIVTPYWASLILIHQNFLVLMKKISYFWKKLFLFYFNHYEPENMRLLMKLLLCLRTFYI